MTNCHLKQPQMPFVPWLTNGCVFCILKIFNVDNCFMKILYSCFIESVWTFSFICWFGPVRLKNRKKLDHIVKLCSKTAGLNLNKLAPFYKVMAMQKAEKIAHTLRFHNIICSHQEGGILCSIAEQIDLSSHMFLLPLTFWTQILWCSITLRVCGFWRVCVFVCW